MLIASGPSTNKFKNLQQLNGRCRVIAIKQNVDLVPFADVCFGCDSAWWRYRKGLEKFKGLRVMWGGNGIAEYPGIRRYQIQRCKKKPEDYSDDLQWESGVVGGGGNSGFQVVNLVAQWGPPKTIGLIGFDFSERNGRHWYGNNNWPGANNPSEGTMGRWRQSMERAAPILKSRGISVFNLSPLSALQCFPFATFDEIMAAHAGA